MRGRYSSKVHGHYEGHKWYQPHEKTGKDIVHHPSQKALSRLHTVANVFFMATKLMGLSVKNLPIRLCRQSWPQTATAPISVAATSKLPSSSSPKLKFPKDMSKTRNKTHKIKKKFFLSRFWFSLFYFYFLKRAVWRSFVVLKKGHQKLFPFIKFFVKFIKIS